MPISKNTMFSGCIAFAIGVLGSTAYAQDFDLVIMGDPQFYRTTVSQNPNYANYKSAQQNRDQVAAIKDYANANSNYVGTVINGDLTEFGRNDGYYNQLDAFNSIYSENSFPGSLWAGLGNHDYQRNVNDSWENNAALRMVQYMDITTRKLRKTKEYVADDFSTHVEWDKHVISGSLSYAWDIGTDYRFIQLNYFPDYKAGFNGWHWDSPWNVASRSPTRRFVSVESSIENGWLKNRLDKAASEGKKVILNMHHTHPDKKGGPARAKLDNLMKNYTNIKAVFMGHIHQFLGQCRNGSIATSIGNSVPVFNSGTPIYSTMLVAKFSPTGMIVDRYSTKGGKATRLGTASNVCSLLPSNP